MNNRYNNTHEIAVAYHTPKWETDEYGQRFYDIPDFIPGEDEF